MKAIFLFLSLAVPLWAGPRPERHVLILQSSADVVFGNTMFATQAGQELDFVVALPKEQIDFRPEPGIEPSELVLDGQLRLKKKTDKEQILSVSFKVPAAFGRATLSFDGAVAGEEWQILVPIGSLQIVGSGWEKGRQQRLGGQIFDAFRRQIAADGPVVLEVKGVAEGRSRFWYLGAALGVFLILLLAVTVIRKRSVHVS